MKSVLIISHGSRSAKTKEEVEQLVEKLKVRNSELIFRYGFLELESPSIPEGIDQCVAAGANEVLVLLNFLNAGRHVDKDIPEIVEESRQKHPKVCIHISPPVGQHPGIVQLFTDIIHDN